MRFPEFDSTSAGAVVDDGDGDGDISESGFWKPVAGIGDGGSFSPCPSAPFPDTSKRVIEKWKI